ncbi:hypothetical protein G6F43_008349 [Rhizopus delemar]|nr:hypothetical protein G6F43_008349 [Rhizopus delemar]
MPNRFIAENGLILNIAMEHAQRCKQEDVALLLDQEKAYDRVHLSYLKKVLLKFRFSPTLMSPLIALFFGNRVCININGHFTKEVDQGRGLRQGDPLSPLLSNLALEPFLRYILQDASIVGFSFSPLSQDLPPPATLKVLAYADDVCVFLSSRADFLRIQHHLNAYGQVSNAKANLSKTKAIFLNGRASPHWQQLPKSKRFNAAIWSEIYSSFMRRKKAINAYYEEVIDILTTAATPAAAHVRQLINLANNSVSNNPIPPDGGENGSTQSDDDIYCDANKDNNTAIPILICPVRSPPSMSTSDEASSSNELLTSTPLSLELHAPGPN